MDNEQVEISAKLKLDTSEAESKLKSVQSKGGAAEVALPKNTKIKLPDTATKSLKNMFSGDSGLDNVAKVAQGATDGFKALGGALTGVTQALGKGAGIIGLIVAIVSAFVKLMQGTDSWEKLTTTFQALQETVQKMLASNIALIGDSIVGVIDVLSEVLQPLLKIASEFSKLSIKPLADTVKALKPLFTILSKILEIVQRIISAFSNTALSVMISVFDILTQLIDDALKPLIEVLDKVLDFIDKIVNKIADFLYDKTGGLINLKRTSLASTTGKKITNNTKTSLDTWEVGGGETAVEKQARLAAEAAERSAEASKSTVLATEGFKDFASNVKDGILNALAEFGTGFVNTIKETWEKAKDIVAKIGETVKDVFVNLFTGIRDKIMSIFITAGQGIVTFVKGMIEKVIDAIAKVFKGIGDTISGVFSALSKGLSSAADMFKSAGEKVMDGVKSFGGKIVEGAKNAGSGLWEGIKNIAGKLKFWKDGGTLDVGAQIWGMSEKGNPEFLFNSGGTNTVVNADILENAMYNAMVAANRDVNNKLEISVKQGTAAGPRELAQWLLPSLKFALGK